MLISLSLIRGGDHVSSVASVWPGGSVYIPHTSLLSCHQLNETHVDIHMIATKEFDGKQILTNIMTLYLNI